MYPIAQRCPLEPERRMVQRQHGEMLQLGHKHFHLKPSIMVLDFTSSIATENAILTLYLQKIKNFSDFGAMTEHTILLHLQ
jgi:hypothetical protein